MRNSEPDANGEPNSHIHADSYTNGDGNSYVYSDSDCDGNIHANSDSDIYGNGDCDGHGDSNCDRTAAAYTDAAASAYTAASPLSLNKASALLDRDLNGNSRDKLASSRIPAQDSLSGYNAKVFRRLQPKTADYVTGGKIIRKKY